jgi:hypothetical protein
MLLCCYALALLAAKRLMHRYARRFAFDVVKRDIDGRNSCLQHASALEIPATLHLLPEGPI